MSFPEQWLTDKSRGDLYLLKYSSLVDLLSGDVTHLQDTQGKGFKGWLLNQVWVMNIQTGEDGLCQGVTLQPRDLERGIEQFIFKQRSS